MKESFWLPAKNRVLACVILVAFFMLLIAIIWRQHAEIERLDRAVETLGRIIDENNDLKARVIELADRCGSVDGDATGR